MVSSTRTRQGGELRSIENDEEYFRWLVAQVQEDGHHRDKYWDLFRILYATPFIWTMQNDDNRLEDGLDLRVEFFHKKKDELRDYPCSMLEVLIALSRRVAWLDSGSAEGWAWQLLCNLDLHKYRDPMTRRKAKQVEEILYALNWRTYDPDGVGGFFPLTRPRGDQRRIEIWYQMHAYVKEIHPEF